MQSVFCKYKSSNKLYIEEWSPSPMHRNKNFHFVKNFSYSLYFFSYVNLGFFFVSSGKKHWDLSKLRLVSEPFNS